MNTNLSGALFLICQFLRSIRAQVPNAINNSLTGIPEVICGPESITVGALTDHPFSGVVYIKNWRRNGACFTDFFNATEEMDSPVLAIPLDKISECGMEMKRDPSTREVVISGVWVFSFHSRFVTKVDRAFSIHCIFKQGELSVTNGFDINSLVTRATLSGTARLPDVHMKVLAGSEPIVGKEALNEVRVGDPITLMWFTPRATEMYGIDVKDCFVETMKGNRVKIVEDGCTLDDIVLSELRRSPDMSEIFALSQAFKFADASDIWFKCSVKICFKPSSAGLAAIEDSCDKPKDCRRLRAKRHVSRRHLPPSMHFHDESTISVNDLVAEHRLKVIDFYNQATNVNTSLNVSSRNIVLYHHKHGLRVPLPPSAVPKRSHLHQPTFCMRKPVFALVSSVIVLMYITAFILSTMAIIFYFRRKNYSDFTGLDLFRLYQSTR